MIFGRRGGRMDGKMEGVIDNDVSLLSRLKLAGAEEV